MCSIESLYLIKSYLRDKRIQDFDFRHSNEEIEYAINNWNGNDRMIIERIFTDLLKEMNIKRQSETAWYLMSALIDRSKYFKS